MPSATKLNRPRKPLGRVSEADIHLMRVFRTVVDCGGFAAAQSELGVGRSTISRQISHLETRLGFTLCYRGRSGFELTQHGKQALLFIDQFFVAADEFTSNISAINDNFTGHVDVAMIDASFMDPKNPMLGAIRAFRTHAPRVKINLTIETPEQIERGVLDSKFHFGILPSYRKLAELSYRHLFDEEVGLYAGPTHPLLDEVKINPNLTTDDVLEHELVYRGYLEGGRLTEFKRHFKRGPVVYATEAVSALVLSGAYLGFLPKHCASKSLTNILPASFEYSSPICAITKKSRDHSVVTTAFLEHLFRT